VLSLAENDDHIFSGSQNSEILVWTYSMPCSCPLLTIRFQVWNKQTFTLEKILQEHTGSILDLEIAKDMNWLFSCDGTSRKFGLFMIEFIAIL
jgi:di- and tripeptidase